MNWQVLLSLKNNNKIIRMLSATLLLDALSLTFQVTSDMKCQAQFPQKNKQKYFECCLLQFWMSLHAFWVKISADKILKYFSYFSQKTGFEFSCKLSPMENGVILHDKSNPVFWKNSKNVTNLSSAEFAQRVVKVKGLSNCSTSATRDSGITVDFNSVQVSQDPTIM